MQGGGGPGGWKPVFGVGLSSSNAFSYNTINYTVQLANYYDTYSNGYFRAVREGNYYIEICSGIKPFTTTELTNQGGFPVLSFTWSSTTQNGAGGGCRAGIVRMSLGVQISINQTFGSAYSDGNLTTTWSMFSVSEAMSNSAYGPGLDNSLLFVTLPNSFNQASNNVPFSDPFVTPSGGRFNSAMNTYTCTRDGNYFFAMSAGLLLSQQVQVQIVIDYNPVGEMIRLSTANANQLTTISRHVLVPCTKDSQVSMYLVQGQLEPGTTRENLLSFTAFEYQLANVSMSSAWSVARTTNWTADSANIDALDFDLTILSYGGVSWDTNSNQVTINIAGYYYIYVSTGVQPSYPCLLSVVRNGRGVFGVYRYGTTHNDVDTLSHGLIIYLNRGDVLRVQAVANSKGFSNDFGLHTSFFGMLLFL
jgi:hypothetical protein